jgi:predicted glycoside hydrolase/deacetylase ChbG (UPF0249 family)
MRVRNLEIIFVADDFGLCAATNDAIVHAYRHGALHGASLMMGQPGTEQAVALAKQSPGLQIGWHLHLCDSAAMTVTRWPWDRSAARAGWSIGCLPKARALMRREIETQWSSFAATGLPCAFVNAHHHLHVHPMVQRVVMEVLPANFAGWIRFGTPKYFGNGTRLAVRRVLGGFVSARRRNNCRYRCSDTLWGVDRTCRLQAGEVRGAITSLPVGLHEFMFHPRSIKLDADVDALIELASP